jgi:hypothetical protein
MVPLLKFRSACPQGLAGSVVKTWQVSPAWHHAMMMARLTVKL